MDKSSSHREYVDMKATRDFDNLVRIMAILRKECPWDREQTHESIKDLMIEEIYEAIDAIDSGNFDELKKELGDLLLHIVFHTEMAREKGKFEIGDVIYGIQEKLIRRHPHVFGNVKVEGTANVVSNWEKIKMKETDRKSVLSGVPNHVPALIKAQRMQEKAGGVGFDWKDWKSAWIKLSEELDELKSAADSQKAESMADELGDVLFSVVNVGRLMGLNAEDCLRLTNKKFFDRFGYIESVLAGKGLHPSDVTLEELDKLWDEAKSKY